MRFPEVRFSSFVLTVSVASILASVLLVVSIHYYWSQQTWQSALEQFARIKGTMVDIMLESRLHDLDLFLDLMSEDGILQDILGEADDEVVERHLSKILYGRRGGTIDLIFLERSRTKGIVSAGIFGNSTQGLQRAAVDWAGLDLAGRLFVSRGPDGPVLAVISRREIVSRRNGRVLARAYAGTILNANADLLRDMMRSSEAEVAALFHGSDLVAAYPLPDWRALGFVPETDGDTIQRSGDIIVFSLPLELPASDGEPVVLATAFRETAIAASADVFDVVYLTGALIVILILVVVTVVVRLATVGSLRRLSSYAQSLQGTAQVSSFTPTAFREFNGVGAALETYVRALRRSEVEAQLILDNASVMVFTHDPDGRFVFANQAFLETCGLDRGAVIGQTETTVFPGRMPVFTAVADHDDPSKPDAPEQLARECQVDFGDGEKTLIIRKVPSYSADGSFFGYCGVATDITERKGMELAIRKALQEASEASRAKSQFLATMSHEFRTPLNAILAFSEVMCKEHFGPIGAVRYRDYACDIYGSGQHMLALVNDILDLSAISAGERRLTFEALSAQDLVAECQRSCRQLAANKQVVLSSNISPAVGPVRGDRLAVVQILFNILSNAIKFTDPGGAVSIDVAAEDGFARIAVSDTGIGIPEFRIATVTEPFRGLHDDPLRAHGGTGLGLSIVKELVGAHHGRMAIDSVVDQGTTVTVWLPLAAAMSVPAPDTDEAARLD